MISFLTLATGLLACGGDSFVVAPPAGTGGAAGAGAGGSDAGGAAGSAAGGSSAAALACRKYATFKNTGSGKCDNCVNDICMAGQIAKVCGGNPQDACNATCGTDNVCFCDCMTTQMAPCGTVVSNTYTCLASQCADACN